MRAGPWACDTARDTGTTRMQTLSCSKGAVIKAAEANGRRLDINGYNALGPGVAGCVRVEGNRGLRADGESKISFARELPQGWHSMDREMVLALVHRGRGPGTQQ